MLTWDRVLTEGPRKESSYLESAKQELQSLVREKERPERLHHNYVTDFRHRVREGLEHSRQLPSSVTQILCNYVTYSRK